MGNRSHKRYYKKKVPFKKGQVLKMIMAIKKSVFSDKDKTRLLFKSIKDRPILWDVDFPNFLADNESTWHEVCKAVKENYGTSSKDENNYWVQRIKIEWAKEVFKFHGALNDGSSYEHAEDLDFMKGDQNIQGLRIKLEPRTFSDDDEAAENRSDDGKSEPECSLGTVTDNIDADTDEIEELDPLTTVIKTEPDTTNTENGDISSENNDAANRVEIEDTNFLFIIEDNPHKRIV